MEILNNTSYKHVVIYKDRMLDTVKYQYVQNTVRKKITIQILNKTPGQHKLKRK